jgi:hypothetical protein
MYIISNTTVTWNPNIKGQSWLWSYDSWWSHWTLFTFKIQKLKFYIWVRVMVFNATFNNISVTSWQSVLLVEKTTDLSQVTDKLYHIIHAIYIYTIVACLVIFIVRWACMYQVNSLIKINWRYLQPLIFITITGSSVEFI